MNMTSRRLGSLALAFVATSASESAPATEATHFDAARVPWTDLEFEASKFFITATAHMQVSLRPTQEVAGEFVTTPQGKPVEPGVRVLELHYGASGLGRDADVTLRLDPVTGVALQYTQIIGGGKSRLRICRFTDIGIYERIRRPATPDEESMPADRWTNRAEELDAYAPVARGKAITDPTALLWLISAAPLAKSGDRIAMLAFSRHYVYEVTAEVAGIKTVRVNYRERGAGPDKRRQGSVQAIRIRINGTNVTPASDDDGFELLSLRGNMELLLDPVTRVPLELSGKAKIVGQIGMHLRSARLGGPPGRPSGSM